MDFIGDTKIDWLKYRWHFIIISLIVALIGALDIARKGGLRYGIDFSEGTIVYAKFEATPEVDVIRKQLRRYKLPVAVAAMFILLLGGGTVALSIMYQNQSRARQEAEEAREAEAEQ